MHIKRITPNKYIVNFLAVFFVFAIVLLHLFLLRVLYLEKFDRKFFNDLYDHSQYSIAQSYRAAGDSTVYQVVGDRLANNVSNVYQVDPQVPPLGKLIIGYSIKYFGNAYIQNIFFFVGLLVGVWFLGVQVLQSKIKSYVLTILVLFDPITVAQLKTVMLDLMSVTLIVWFVNLQLLVIKKAHNNKFIFITLNLLSGAITGFLASIKFGVLVPFLIAATLLACVTPNIFINGKMDRILSSIKWKRILFLALLLFFGFLFGLIVGHYKYFLEDNSSIIGFIKNEKWVFTYWLGGASTGKNYLMIFVSMITGFYKHFTSGSGWEWAFDTWNPIWALGIFGWGMCIWMYIRGKAKTNHDNLYVFITILLIMIVYSILPFYYRYIVHISPFIFLGLFHLPYNIFERRKKMFYTLIALLLISILLKNVFLFFEQPKEISYDFERFSKLKLYKDLYEKLEVKSRPSLSYEQFWDTIYTAESGLGRHEISLTQLRKPGIIMPWQSIVKIPYKKTYITEHGNISHYFDLILVRNGHKLNIRWSNEYVYKDYDFGAKFVVSPDKDITYGKVYDKTGKLITKREERLFGYIKPSDIKDEQSVIVFFEKNMTMSQFDIEAIYKVNFPSHLVADIGILPKNYEVRQNLPQGVIIEKKESWNDMPSGIDPTILGKQGAKIYFINSKGSKKLILDNKSIQGKDIYL